MLSAAEIQKLTGVNVMMGASSSAPEDPANHSDRCTWHAEKHFQPNTILLTIEDLDLPPGKGQIEINFIRLKSAWLRSGNPRPLAVKDLGDEALYQEEVLKNLSTLLVRHGARALVIQGIQRQDVCVNFARLVMQRM